MACSPAGDPSIPTTTPYRMVLMASSSAPGLQYATAARVRGRGTRPLRGGRRSRAGQLGRRYREPMTDDADVLLEAVLSVGRGLELEGTLHRVVQAAADM